MRQKVITFLESLPKAPEDQFNEALLYYMKSPVPNASLVRSYNQQGYSVQRLKELLYDLKKAFEIKDSELVVKREPKPEGKVVQLPKTPIAPGLPEFSKGITGTSERKAYLKEHNLTSPSFKNADMDAVILEHVKSVEANKTAGDPLPPTPDDLAFNKVLELAKAGENIPASLVRELYNNPLMSDEHVIAITEEAKKHVTPKEPEVNLPEFSKGIKGTAERKAYLKKHNLTSDSFKNADMDAVILEHVTILRSNSVNTPDEASDTKKAAEIEVKETETPNPESEKK